MFPWSLGGIFFMHRGNFKNFFYVNAMYEIICKRVIESSYTETTFDKLFYPKYLNGKS